MKKTVFTFLIALACFRVTAQPDPGAIPVLIRCDDIGMCQSVNAAARQVLETGMPVSMSVMVNCPWFSDAVALLNKYYNVSVGIHLTLNSEWKQYKWGPVAGASAVPSLVDSLGYFFPSRSLLYANQPKLEEIELELRLQIVKALKAGLDVDYLDYHMGTAVQTPETRAIVEKLAKEFGLAISRYFDEVDVPGGYIAPITSKLDTLTALVKNLKPGGTKLFVFHIGRNTPEMAAMEDMNAFGLKEMGRHREAELNALLDPAFLELLQSKKHRLVNYKMLKEEKGLMNMRRPAQ